MTFQEFQQALIDLGYDLGPAGADGVPGRLTQAAILAFKATVGLSNTTTVGPQTVAAVQAALAAKSLRPAPGLAIPPTPDHPEPIWMVEAARYLGVQEVVGPGSNPTILGWARALGSRLLGMNYTDDDTPWCGLFVAHCIAVTLPTEPIPSVPVRASAWLDFGQRLSAPALGAVMVFTRAGGGHVGFYAGETESAFYILGGNQSNRVSRTWIAKDRSTGFRWPSSVAMPNRWRVLVDRNGAPLSRNEG